MASLRLLPMPMLSDYSFGFSSRELSPSTYHVYCNLYCSRIRLQTGMQLGVGLRCGASWGGLLRRTRVEHGVVRMMSLGDNDVVVEEAKQDDEEPEPLLLRMGVSLVTEILRLFSNFGRYSEVFLILV